MVVVEECKYLDSTWGGQFTGATCSFSWARKQMEFKFFSYIKEYKNEIVKVSIGKRECYADLGDGDYIKIKIKEGGNNNGKHLFLVNENSGQ